MELHIPPATTIRAFAEGQTRTKQELKQKAHKFREKILKVMKLTLKCTSFRNAQYRVARNHVVRQRPSLQHSSFGFPCSLVLSSFQSSPSTATCRCPNPVTFRMAVPKAQSSHQSRTSSENTHQPTSIARPNSGKTIPCYSLSPTVRTSECSPASI